MGIVGVRAGTLGHHHIPQLQLGGDGTGTAHPDDVVHIVEMVELVGVDADGGHAHAGGHHGHRCSAVSAGVAVDAPDMIDQPGVFQKCFGDEFGPQRVAGHQNSLCKRAVCPASL